MRAIYDARIDELKPHHRIRVVCYCGHESELKPAAIEALNLPGHTRILDVGKQLRCMKCRKRGEVNVSVRSIEGHGAS